MRLIVSFVLILFARPAFADQRYVLSGFDRYRVGASELNTEITYSGKETLSVARRGHQSQYMARATYVRSDESGKSPGQASFAATLLPSGEQHDDTNADPNYLTVLNQPFAAQLDAQTLRDLEHLRGALPFDFPSPMTGGTLQGSLRRGVFAKVAGRQVLGVRFEAAGPMRGPLPDHPTMSLTGTISMQGVAYYERDSALLLALDATLTILGKLDNDKKATPVSIVYKRSLRAQGAPQSVKEAASSPPR